MDDKSLRRTKSSKIFQTTDLRDQERHEERGKKSEERDRKEKKGKEKRIRPEGKEQRKDSRKYEVQGEEKEGKMTSPPQEILMVQNQKMT